MKETKMIRQKIQTFLLVFIPFGLGVSFSACFFEKQPWILFAVLGVDLIGSLFCFCVPKMRKGILEALLKIQPSAAVIFAASFILSFHPCRMWAPQMFAVAVLSFICVCLAFERQKSFNKTASFAMVFFTAAVTGCALAFVGNSVSAYVAFVLAALCCRPVEVGRTMQDLWQDIAFPMFVLVCSFLSFVAASHLESFFVSIAEAAVMVMTGALLISSRVSGLRLMLMTAAVLAFGCYVFSGQNPDSLFNQTGRIQKVVEKSV